MRASPSPSALVLLVMSRRGSHAIRLPAVGELTIGRADECEIPVDDEKVSRRHAILRLGREVQLSDLGSKNGTIVGARRLEPRETVVLALGDVVRLGGTLLRVERAASTMELVSGRVYARRLEELIANEGPFALLAVRLHPVLRARAHDSTTAATTRDELRAADVEAALRGALAPDDTVTAMDAWSYRALLPKRGPGDAAEVARQVGSRLVARGVRADLGVASYPDDGARAELLERAAHGALRDVGGAPPARVDPPASRGPRMRELDAMIDRVAGGAINVLLMGETGVGKEVTARAIHDRSPRAAAPLVAINCAAFSEALFDSELFGYERGAFTGADRPKPGLLESAEGGTVFLDEVGEMPLALQAKLLRVLETREVLRLGSVRPRAIDVRILSATNRELEAEIEARRFRRDLYFRLNGISLTIPPLRERAEEIPALATQFIEAASLPGRDGVRPALHPDALAILLGYAWPGNVRELRNVMERAVLLCAGPEIRPEHLLIDGTPSVAPGPLAPATSSKDDGGERQRILDALDRCAGNQTYAADLLGISRRTLVTRLRTFGIARPRTRPKPSR